ncbi:MAG: hypothetical protein ACXVA9_00800, partial [Bdellovibrionales bacterium]
APPGSVLIFSGPCTPGYPHPEGTFGCGSGAGNRVGHVTIKGDAKSDGRQYYYTDGRTEDPAIRHRYFVAAYIPGPSQNALCGGN